MPLHERLFLVEEALARVATTEKEVDAMSKQIVEMEHWVSSLSEGMARIEYELHESQMREDRLKSRLDEGAAYARFLGEELKRVDGRLAPDTQRPLALATDHHRLALVEVALGGYDVVQRGVTASQLCDRLLRAEGLIDTLGAAVGRAPSPSPPPSTSGSGDGSDEPGDSESMVDALIDDMAVLDARVDTVASDISSIRG